jgi:hypothetical protein
MPVGFTPVLPRSAHQPGASSHLAAALGMRRSRAAESGIGLGDGKRAAARPHRACPLWAGSHELGGTRVPRRAARSAGDLRTIGYPVRAQGVSATRGLRPGPGNRDRRALPHGSSLAPIGSHVVCPLLARLVSSVVLRGCRSCRLQGGLGHRPSAAAAMLMLMTSLPRAWPSSRWRMALGASCRG